jgi:hypothetical protein
MTGSTTVSNPSDDFHIIYTLDWNSKRIHFYLRSSNGDDHIKFFCYKNDATGKDSWPFDLISTWRSEIDLKLNITSLMI